MMICMCVWGIDWQGNGGHVAIRDEQPQLSPSLKSLGLTPLSYERMRST